MWGGGVQSLTHNSRNTDQFQEVKWEWIFTLKILAAFKKSEENKRKMFLTSLRRRLLKAADTGETVQILTLSLFL